MRAAAETSPKTTFSIRGLRSCFQPHWKSRCQPLPAPLLNRCRWRSLSSILFIEISFLFALGTIPKGRHQTESEPAARTFYLDATIRHGCICFTLRRRPSRVLGRPSKIREHKGPPRHSLTQMAW